MVVQTDRKNLKYQPQFAVGNVGQYSYFHEEDESQFTLVDQSRVNKPLYKKSFRSVASVNCLIDWFCLNLSQLCSKKIIEK